MRVRKQTTHIVIHKAATKPSMDIDVDWIADIHVVENGWDDVGYHYFIQRDGTVDQGRDITMQGAHCPGMNHKSVAICMAGGMAEGSSRSENNFTEAQWEALVATTQSIMDAHHIGVDGVRGHSECAEGKDCPSFSMEKFRSMMVSTLAVSRTKFMGSVNNEGP